MANFGGPVHHLPQNHAGRIEVASRIDRSAELLFRRDVPSLPEVFAAHHRFGETVPPLGQTEIDDLDAAVVGDKDVAGGDIAVDQVEPLDSMHVREPAQDLLDDEECEP